MSCNACSDPASLAKEVHIRVGLEKFVRCIVEDLKYRSVEEFVRFWTNKDCGCTRDEVNKNSGCTKAENSGTDHAPPPLKPTPPADTDLMPRGTALRPAGRRLVGVCEHGHSRALMLRAVAGQLGLACMHPGWACTRLQDKGACSHCFASQGHCIYTNQPTPHVMGTLAQLQAYPPPLHPYRPPWRIRKPTLPHFLPLTAAVGLGTVASPPSPTHPRWGPWPCASAPSSRCRPARGVRRTTAALSPC